MIRVAAIPQHTLLARYVESGAYADCYATEVPFAVTHAQFVEAFYTTGLFRIERLLLRVFLARTSTDSEVRQMAQGTASTFAAWTVEARADNEILLAAGRTRSWLMVAHAEAPGYTRLYFGSAVVPPRTSGGARSSMGFLFTALLGFHKLYSRALLWSARARLIRQFAGAGDQR